MILTEFISVLEDIEQGNNPRIEYNLYEGIQRIFKVLGKEPSSFFWDVHNADSPEETEP